MRQFISILRHGGVSRSSGKLAAAAIAMISAGCSADVTRFDSSSFSFDENSSQTTASVPVPSKSVYGQDASITNDVAQSVPRGPHRAGAYDADSNNGRVELAALPDAPPSSGRESVHGFAQSPRGEEAHAKSARARDPIVPRPIQTGETIDVQSGDTLYGLSRRHKVSLADLMAVNNLKAPNIKPGQKLVLPSGGEGGPSPSARPSEAVAAEARAERDTSAPALSGELSAKYAGSYTVKQGDSLYNLARSYKVPFTELQQVNGIDDPRRVRPGRVLKVPGTAVASTEPIAPAGPVAETPPEPERDEPPSLSSATTTQPTILNSKGANEPEKTEERVALAPSSAANAGAETKSSEAKSDGGDPSKLRWPVNGRIIAGFGARPDGTHNDGVNLSVPLGTEVHAAETGVVAYAGSELKGYGNLVLLRHDNGWVTAYAHNEELLVKRGDKVRRGHVIAKAGKTGTVDQPQVHFEVRQGAKPVDPIPFLERL